MSPAAIAKHIASFESGASKPRLPAGAHSGGSDFEDAITDAFTALLLETGVDSLELHAHPSQRLKQYVAKPTGARHLLILSQPLKGMRIDTAPAGVAFPDPWSTTTFHVQTLLDAHLGPAIKRFAPHRRQDSHHYHGRKYPDMYSRLKTTFDFSMALVRDNVLVEKILFEFKSAKSSQGQHIDGNAHERLMFQALQYLEITQTQVDRCRFVVIASSAFSQYRNKYHPCFHQQATRLGNAFPNFHMHFLSNVSEYVGFLSALKQFIRTGIWHYEP